MEKISAVLIAFIVLVCCCISSAVGAEDDMVTREEFESLKAELLRLQNKLEPGSDQAETDHGKSVDDGMSFGEYWKEGLHFKSEDGAFDLRVGGRVDVDGAYMTAADELKDEIAEIPDNDSFESGWELRHPRIYLKGRIYEYLLYKIQYTLSDETIGDAYVGAANVPFLGTVIIGKAARAFGNDPGPSSNYTLFMEYANTIIFGAGKQMGLAAGSPVFNNCVSWAVQLFQFVDGKGLRTEDNYNLNLRFTGLPWYKEKGREMLHLGADYSFRSSKDDYRLRARPEIHLAPYFVDTGNIAIRDANIYAVEAAWVTGPFSLEGEWYNSIVNREGDLSNLSFSGFYIQSCFFLTGESRGEQYVTSYGEFDSPVRPRHNADFKKGEWGAWQLAARYSYLDLNDDDLRGGILGDVTLGLNWQLNPNFRWMLNYVHSQRNGAGDADIIATRFAVNI